MPIPMNANPESAALIGGAWPEYDESTYRADAEVQRKLSGTAEDGANVTRKVGNRTADFQGAAGTALQDALSRDRSQLTTQQSVHHATASKLENLAAAIENHKHNLNAIDNSYHAQKATLIATGADPADLAQLQAQAQSYVGTAQSTFGAAYEGMVDTLLADADAAEGKPKPAPGGVELAEFKDDEPGSAAGDADKADGSPADAPNDIDSGSDATAEDKSEAAPTTEPDTSEGAATEPAPAVEDKAGTAAPVPAAPAPAAPVVPAAPAAPAVAGGVGGVGGVGAVPAAPAAAAGSTQAKDMGYATGQAATQFGAGLLSGLANQPAPGMAAPGQYGQTGYAPQAFGQGYPQQGFGQGFGGMPQAGGMNGYGQMNPAAFGQAAAAPLAEAGNAIGQFANQTANAMTGSDTGVAGLLGDALAGDHAGEPAPAAADGPATELKSQVIDAIDQYLDDPSSSESSGGDPAPETAEDSTTVDPPSSDTDDAAADTDSAGSDSGDAEDPGDAADESSETPAPVADPPAAPDTSADPAGTPITANPTETVDPITRLQNGAGAAVDQVAMGLHGAIDGTADTARHLAGFPPVDASAPVTHTSAGAALSPATGLSANEFGHAPAAHTAAGAAATAGGGAIGGAPQMMAPAAPAVAPAAGGPANLWTPPPSAPAPSQTPLQSYGSGQPGPAHNNTGGAPPAGGGDGRINHVPTPPPTAAAANAEAAVILSGLPASEVRAHQVLASLRKQQSVNEFVTPTAVGVFKRGDVAELIVATADGVSYLPEGAGLPEGVRLITDFELPAGFYRHWSGYFSPVAKLAALSKDAGHRVGTLTLALSSEPDRVQNDGVQSFVQTADQFLRLSNGGALAPTVRGRAQSAAQPSQEERQAVASLAAEQDIRAEDYNEWAAQVHAARWYDPERADEYRMAWVRFLVCGALRAESHPTPDEAGLGYAIAELRRAVMAAPVGTQR